MNSEGPETLEEALSVVEVDHGWIVDEIIQPEIDRMRGALILIAEVADGQVPNAEQRIARRAINWKEKDDA